jgi:hypothetical protein
MFLDPQELMSALLPAVWATDDGVVWIDYGERSRVTLEMAQLAYQRHRQLAPDRRSPVLVMSDGLFRPEAAALRFLHADTVGAITAAVGIVTRERLARHLANLRLAYAKPPYPVRRFASSRQALQWLREQVASEEPATSATPRNH